MTVISRCHFLLAPVLYQYRWPTAASIDGCPRFLDEIQRVFLDVVDALWNHFPNLMLLERVKHNDVWRYTIDWSWQTIFSRRFVLIQWSQTSFSWSSTRSPRERKRIDTCAEWILLVPFGNDGSRKLKKKKIASFRTRMPLDLRWKEKFKEGEQANNPWTVSLPKLADHDSIVLAGGRFSDLLSRSRSSGMSHRLKIYSMHTDETPRCL